MHCVLCTVSEVES